MNDLPEVNGYNALMVVIDKFGKVSRLVPCRVGEGQLTAPQVAQLFFDHWVWFFGVPQYIMHDRDVPFTAAFWKALWGMLGMQKLFSSAYHPQTDGQTEWQNRTTEQVIQALAYEGKNWVQSLTLAELAINNAVAEPTGMSPTHVTYG